MSPTHVYIVHEKTTIPIVKIEKKKRFNQKIIRTIFCKYSIWHHNVSIIIRCWCWISQSKTQVPGLKMELPDLNKNVV